MPIVRTFMCGECGHHLQVTLSMDQWDSPPPECPECARHPMDIDFRPIALGGSTKARAAALAEKIAAEDYHVADMQIDGRDGGKPNVRYKDINPNTLGQASTELMQTLKKASNVARTSNWGATNEALQTAITLGRQTRMQYGGNGLDMLQRALKDGVQPDLIEQSKKRAMKVW